MCSALVSIARISQKPPSKFTFTFTFNICATSTGVCFRVDNCIVQLVHHSCSTQNRIAVFIKEESPGHQCPLSRHANHGMSLHVYASIVRPYGQTGITAIPPPLSVGIPNKQP